MTNGKQLKINFVNDWAGKFYYGGSLIMIGWLKLHDEDFFSFSFVVLGIGFSVTKGSL